MRYLLYYRNTPHCTTNETPAKRILNRELRTRFDLLRDRVNENNQDKQIENYKGNRNIEFQRDELVFVRDYRVQNKPTWVKARVVKILGPRNYLCSVCENESLIWKRHLDQMIKTGSFFDGVYKKIKNGVCEKEYENEKLRGVQQSVIPELVKSKEKEFKLSEEEHSVKSDVKSQLIREEIVNDNDENLNERMIEGNEISKTPKEKERMKATWNVNERLKRIVGKQERLNL